VPSSTSTVVCGWAYFTVLSMAMNILMEALAVAGTRRRRRKAMSNSPDLERCLIWNQSRARENAWRCNRKMLSYEGD
jgi:hypothetical protein